MTTIRILRRFLNQLNSKTTTNNSYWVLSGRIDRLKYVSSRCLSTSHYWLKDSSTQQDGEPIKYTTSEAKQWQSFKTFEMPERVRNMPPYQPYSIIISVLIFLVYFAVLREENDLDEMLGVSLYDRMPGLEAKNIRVAIDHEKRQGKSTVDLERRLAEIEKEE